MSDTDQQSSAPLAHIRVLDLTRVRAGPHAVRQLSDWGAQVIKVEGPYDDDMTGARDGSDFQNLHRNKRSIVLDLKQQAGVETLRKLAAGADVLVENFRPDVKHRLGIDYEAMRAANPRLVYASISGFGQNGPYRERPGFDQIAQAMGGLMSITGEPGQVPQRAGIPVADLCAGLYCALGVLIALVERSVTGTGRWVQTSLLQAQVAMLDFQATTWLVDGKVPGQIGNRHPYTTPMGVFPAADGNVVIGASGQEQYKKFCAALDANHMLTDERFATAEGRTRNIGAFTEAASAETRKYSMSVLVERLNAAGVACGPINAIDKVFADPQIQDTGIVRSLQHPRLGLLNLLSSPIAMSGTQPVMARAAPEKGGETDAILREVGLGDEDIEKLRVARAVL
ncbi:MAG TPA: CaiB/BaiF CoA-transferase family protein [Hyphomicrobiaceae bacterium]